MQKPLLAQSHRVVTLVDSNLREQDLHVASARLEAGAKTIQPDLVRQWRDGLGREIAHAKGALAYVRWDKAMILTGLARETGMNARQRRLGRGLFEVRIRVS